MEALADLAWCPRCGRESWDNARGRCAVCALTADPKAVPDLVFTIIFTSAGDVPEEIGRHVSWRRDGTLRTAGEGRATPTEYYTCFTPEEAGAMLPLLTAPLDIGVLVNGRPRPYARDLWLPLLAFLAQGDGTVPAGRK
ncbi:MAG: hypothetical protein HYV63_22035 [Candidatus Schekmanbacteria bacterium]|nr:hypothetical protein [Candidatus Schekmanbacteria bacterium]